jgi:hypothetical protein
MFKKTVHPLDLLLAVLAAVTPGGAILYWLAITDRLPFDFVLALAFLVGTAAMMLIVVGGMVWFALRMFSPRGWRD